MGTGTLCREAEKSVPVPMWGNQVLNSYNNDNYETDR